MNTAILNVLLQFVEGLISFEFYESIAPTKKKLRNFAIITIGYMVMCAINLAFDYNFIINSFVLLSFMFVFAKVLFKIQVGLSFFISILFVTFVTLSEYAVSSLISIVTQNEVSAVINDPYSYMVLIVASKSILFFALKIASSFIKKHQIKAKINVLVLAFPAAVLINCSVFALIASNFNLTDTYKILISVCAFVMFVTSIVVCILQQRESEREAELVELRAIKQAQETDNKYFEILEHQNNNLMVYAHDTKNHLQAIHNMTDDENIIEYLERLSADLNKYSRHASSGNHNLDVIINKYITECEIKGVSFDYDVRLSNLSGVQMFDLVSILGNLLDNALESAEKSTGKSIHLQTDHRNTYDVIIVTNSCDTKPVTQGNVLKSSKANKKQHGLGIKSIKSSLKNYSGDYNWEYDEQNNEFISTVMILRK